MDGDLRLDGAERGASVARRPIFAVFEGGGAKGVAHVGALQAIEDHGLDIIGVAGTSAGALFAVLCAIGLEAADIMAVDDPLDNLLMRSGQTPVGLLGRQPWSDLQRLRRHGTRLLIATALAGLLGGALATPGALGTLWTAYDRRGHFDAARIADFVNGVIRERLEAIATQAGLGWPVPSRVTFGDLARGWPTVIPLKVIATDVDAGQLVLFDAHATPDVVVAEAVAASIAIPLVFQPASIPSFRPGCFADGGLVSNLPIWSFSEEKLGWERENWRRPPVPVLGFRLADAEPPAPGSSASGLLTLLRRLVSAALQGGQATVSQFLDDVTIVPLTTHLGLLDFDAPVQDYGAARLAGYVSAHRVLRSALQLKPDRIAEELRTVRERVLRHLNKERSEQEQPLLDQVRVNVIRPHGQVSLRVMQSEGMHEDADDRLLLDRRGRGAAEAVRLREICSFRFPDSAAVRSAPFMTKYERALLRPSVVSLICVPIFADAAQWGLQPRDRQEPAGVLAIDSDTDIVEVLNDTEIRNFLGIQSAVLYALVQTEVFDG